jgi:hypothetical protein
MADCTPGQCVSSHLSVSVLTAQQARPLSWFACIFWAWLLLYVHVVVARAVHVVVHAPRWPPS